MRYVPNKQKSNVTIIVFVKNIVNVKFLFSQYFFLVVIGSSNIIFYFEL